MPYIEQSRREDLLHAETKTTGELNYMLTAVVKRYLDSKGLSYTTVNDIVGALECAKAEFLRRVVAPYEDLKIKIKDNGDVYK